MLGRIYNEDSFEALADIANECPDPVIVTDPPFNIGYHYRTYGDRIPEDVYFSSLAEMFCEYPSVVVHYPEQLHRLSMEMGEAPGRVVSWVYNSNNRRQHRDIAFWRVRPDFERVRQPPQDARDHRNDKSMAERGGCAPTTGCSAPRSRTCHGRRRPTRARCRYGSWSGW